MLHFSLEMFVSTALDFPVILDGHFSNVQRAHKLADSLGKFNDKLMNFRDSMCKTWILC